MKASTYLLSVIFGIYLDHQSLQIGEVGQSLVGWRHVSSELLIIEEDMDSDAWQENIEKVILMMEESLKAETSPGKHYIPTSHTLCKVR